MSTRFKLSIGFVYSLIVAACLYHADPNLPRALIASLPRVETPSDKVLPALIEQLAPAASPATSMFRGAIERTGVYSASLTMTLKPGWEFHPLNVGVHGASKASPAVDASGVYVGTDAGYFLAFDHQGNLRWQVYLSDSSRGIHGTAALDGATVYVGGYNGVISAFDKQTGARRWTKKVGDALGSSPVLQDGALYIGVETNHPDGFLLKLRARDGEMIWATDWLGEQTHSSPTISLQNNVVLIGSNQSYLHAFDLRTGKPRWVRTLLAEMKSTALVVGQIVFATSWEGRLLALDVTNGHQLWAKPLSGISQVSPTYLPSAGLVAVADHNGEISAYDIHSGLRRWHRATKIKHYITSGAVSEKGSHDILWTICRARTLCALDSANGEILGQTPLAGELTGQPVPYGSSLYLAFDGIEGGLHQLIGRSR